MAYEKSELLFYCYLIVVQLLYQGHLNKTDTQKQEQVKR